jgi:hypothetical protein
VLTGFVLFMGWQSVSRQYDMMARSGSGGLSSSYVPPSAWGWLTGGAYLQTLTPSPAGYQLGYASMTPPRPPASGAAPAPSTLPPVYRGLPVRRPLPQGVRQIELVQESAARPQLLLMLVAPEWVIGLKAALLLVAGLLCGQHRRSIVEGFRGALGRVGQMNRRVEVAASASSPTTSTHEEEAAPVSPV